MNEYREYFNAYLSGLNSSWYAPNATVCMNNFMNLYQNDIEHLAIKLMYGDFKQNVLNTTLFAKNISDTAYFCLDAAENVYVFFMYKLKLFNYDFLNLFLGFLQNFFKQMVAIFRIYQ